MLCLLLTIYARSPRDGGKGIQNLRAKMSLLSVNQSPLSPNAFLRCLLHHSHTLIKSVSCRSRPFTILHTPTKDGSLMLFLPPYLLPSLFSFWRLMSRHFMHTIDLSSFSLSLQNDILPPILPPLFAPYLPPSSFSLASALSPSKSPVF